VLISASTSRVSFIQIGVLTGLLKLAGFEYIGTFPCWFSSCAVRRAT
jgi:hypothetical protein